MDFVIRKAAPQDAAEICELCKRVIFASNTAHYTQSELCAAADAYNPGKLEKWIADEVVLCGWLEEKLIGCCILKGPFVAGWFVEREYQRQGLGSRLLGCLLELAQEKKHLRVFVFSSLTAEICYKKNGFKFVMKAYGDQYDGLFMYKHLGSGEDNFKVPKFWMIKYFAVTRVRKYFRIWRERRRSVKA